MGMSLALQEAGLVEVQAKGAFPLVASLEGVGGVAGMRKVASLGVLAGQEVQVVASGG
jgi:hypothetical protein